MNSVILIGRLATEPELSFSQSQTAVVKFNMAVQRRGKRDEADFIRIVAFNKLAELIQKYTAKGLQVAVHGRIRTGQYTTKDGDTRYTTEIIADEVDFLQWKDQDREDDLPVVNDEDIPF